MDKISIVLPIWLIDKELKDLTERCICTLKEFTDFPYELIVIDNNSPFRSAEIETIADIYIRNTTNKGNGYAWSQGANAATGKYILFSDNDVEFSENWYKPLIKELENKKTGVVVPLTWNYRDQDTYNPQLSGFFWMIRTELFDEIGDFDPVFGIANFEDSDYFKRVQNKGYEIVCCSKSKIKHFSRATCDRVPEVQQVYKRNETYYFNKHGVLPMLDRLI